MNVGLPNFNTRDQNTQTAWWSWSISADDTSVSGWDPLTANETAPTATNSIMAYGGTDFVTAVYTATADWGFRFNKSGFYQGYMEIDISTNLFAAAQTLNFNLGLNGAVDSRSPLAQARFQEANDKYIVRLPIIGEFAVGDEIMPGQSNSTTAGNEFGSGIIKIELRRVRELA